MIFAASLLAVMASAVAAVPSSHHLRNVEHSGLAKRVESHLLAKRFTANRITWYPTNTGPDACTGRNHGDYDNIVALNVVQWENNKHCGKMIRITANGRTATGVIQDKCATCYEKGEIDLTLGLFQKFANKDDGIFRGTWEFIDGDNNDHPEPPKETPKTSSTKKPANTPPAPPKSTPAATRPAQPTHDVEPPKNVAPSPTKAAQPTKAPVVADNEDDDEDEEDDDEDCEEYEDDDEEEEPEPVKASPPPPPVKAAPPPPPVKAAPPPPPPVKVSSSKVIAATPPAIKVESTPSSVVVSVGATPSAPAPPVANPAAEPTTSETPNDVSGGISSGSTFGNGAVSISYNKVVPAIMTLVFLAVQL